MKIARRAIWALILGVAAGVASAQTQAAPPCPPQPPSARQPGSFSSASTVAPPTSPLIGLPNPFREDFDWAKMPSGIVYGSTRAIAIDKDGKSIWVFDRCGLTSDGCAKVENKNVNPIMKFDFDGNLVKSFGAGMFVAPHGIFVDEKGNLWLADSNVPAPEACLNLVGNTVREFTPAGKLLMTINGPQGGKPFTGLTEAIVAPNGDIYVADGHEQPANNRILKFDRHGKYLMEWGTTGSGPRDLSTPHDLAVDKESRIYVADRGNSAVKVFDENGKLLHDWKQFGTPTGLFVRNEMLYVADGAANGPNNPDFAPGVRIASVSDGKILFNIPYAPGNNLEGVTVDAAGNVYGGATNHPRAVRWLKVQAP